MSRAHAPGRTFFSVPANIGEFEALSWTPLIASTPPDGASWFQEAWMTEQPPVRQGAVPFLLKTMHPPVYILVMEELLKQHYNRILHAFFDPVISRQCGLFFGEHEGAGEGPFASPDIGPTTVCLSCDAIIPVSESYHKRTDETFVLCEFCFKRWEQAGRAKESQP